MRGLVLEGGGVKGAYQIGAFYAFLNSGIRFNGYAGTSIGSFNAEMLVEGKHKELLDFWYNLDSGELFGFNKNYVDAINEKEYDINFLLGLFDTAVKTIKNFGIDNKKLFEVVDKYTSFDRFKASKKDFGLVTVKVSRKMVKPCYILKNDIHSHKELREYLMASCYLPVFREKRMLDNHFYIDGGFYDNSPVKIFKDLNYDEVYVINIKGIGISRKRPDNIKVIEIKPSRDNGHILELNKDVIRDNIKMGYYDTLRVIKHLDGYKYCFKKRSNRYYEFISRKVDKKLMKRVMSFFKTVDVKDTIIKSLEYIMDKEHIDYYDIYTSRKIISKYRKNNSKHFIYRFIREIKYILPF